MAHPQHAPHAPSGPDGGLIAAAALATVIVAGVFTLVGGRFVAAPTQAAGGPAGAAIPMASQAPSSKAHPQADVSIVEATLADRRAQLCTSANAVGVGLQGEYFAKPGFAGPAIATRVDASLDLTGPADWPQPQAGGGALRSVRWSGWVKAPITGAYRFHGEPGGLAIRVADQPVAGPGAARDASVQLAAGRFYPIEVTLERLDTRTASLKLEWTAPHGARFVIPRNSLFLPTETVAPKPKG